ncbi:hypothetical protein N7G274_010536 [Stereocaulon virgatum]|uniref:RING-type domain-containing protein n=1 Tax=Stereocaulon virgatum TaxID=373712 RepID=A0ABR3ZVS4_9LECA
MSRAEEVAEWLDKIPVIPVHDMAKEDRICCICHNEYAKHNPEGVMECPVRLPGACCGHVFGKECLKKWLIKKDTCPMCRHVQLHHRKDGIPLSRPLADTDLESFDQNPMIEESDATRLETYNETLIGERPPQNWGQHVLTRHFVAPVEQPSSFTNAPYEHHQSTEPMIEQGSAHRPGISAENHETQGPESDQGDMTEEPPRQRRGALLPRPDTSDSETPQD